MFLKGNKEYYLIIGNNKENGLIIDSLKSVKNSESIILFDQDEPSNHVLNIKKFIKTNPSNFTVYLKKTFKNIKKSHINIIINIFDNTKSIDYVNEIKLLVNELDLDTKTFNVYAFIDVMDYHILDELNANSNGTINIFNKDRLVALSFVSNTPITKYMNDGHIDFEKAIIKNDININVIMLGFGGVNQEIFKAYISSTAFAQISNGKVVSKNINYYLYDKDNLENNRYLNQYYYHYEKEFLSSINRNDYLPLPNIPCNLYLNNCNVYSLEFLRMIKNNLSNGAIPYNYIVISLSDDLTNISLGNTILNKLNEWNLIDYTKVFVYVKENSLYRYMPKNLHYFGNNLDIFNVNNICHNFFKHVSIKRNFIYQIEQLLNNDSKVKEFESINDKINYLKGEEEKILNDINKQFGNTYLISKEANTYSLLSIRNKLNLLGFDYELQDSTNISESSDYYKAYEKNNMIEYVKDLIYKGKGVINYPLLINKKFEINPRNVLAFLEHNRWNAYMIASGVTPSSIEDILISVNEKGENTNGKDIRNYKHGHLTNYDGLSKFVYLLVNREIDNNKGKAHLNKEALLKKYDILKYDYQLMDDADYFLSDDEALFNYVIVHKKYLDTCKSSRLKGVSKENIKKEKVKIDNIVTPKIKKEEPKKEEIKKVEPKKAETKKEDIKKVEPKKEDNKKEQPKKVENVKEEPKKVEANKVEPKKEEVKKVEPKKAEDKKEEPNKQDQKVKPNGTNNKNVLDDSNKKDLENKTKLNNGKKPYIPYWKKKKNKNNNKGSV